MPTTAAGKAPSHSKNFALRRLVRLHPMVLMGAVLGVITFVLQGSQQWDGTHMALSAVMWALLMAMFMIPALPGCGYEVRGNGEMFPLNGPTWSLFFEYIGNVLYAPVLRRFSTRVLNLWVAFLGIMMGLFACLNVSGYGSIGVGWTLDTVNFFRRFAAHALPLQHGFVVVARTPSVGRTWCLLALFSLAFCAVHRSLF